MESKTCTFYAPCPVLDVEAMQTWLEDLSGEGYLLKRCSAVGRKFEFYRIEPLPIRYRLTPVSDKIEEWNLRPNEEFVSITDAYGWEHVCSSYRLHIFRAYDADAPEIHTDPLVQAQAVRQLGWRMLNAALFWLMLPLVYLLVIYVFGGADYFWQSVIINSSGSQIVMAYFVLVALIKTAVELAWIYPLYIRLKRGEVPSKRKNWRKRASVHRAICRVCSVLLVVFAVTMVIGRAAYRERVGYRELPPVGTELPFLSVADMAQRSGVKSAERMEDVNYMRSWSHVLSPVNYDWAEIVEVVDKDGKEGLVSIHVYYHETGSPWLAESLTKEYLEKAKQPGSEMAEVSAINADLAYFYYNEYGTPSAVLKYGKTVVCVEFPRMDIDVPTLKFSYWIETLDHMASANNAEN